MATRQPLTASILDSAHNQSFQNADFKVVGRDMSTVNINLNTHGAPPGSDWTLASDGAGAVTVISRDVYTDPPTTPPMKGAALRPVDTFERISRVFMRKPWDDPNVPLPPTLDLPRKDPRENTSPSLGGRTRGAEDSHGQSSPLSSGTSSSSSSDGDTISVLSADSEELDKRTIRATKSEVYVRNMLGHGKGLPCADPRPRKPLSPETGVMIGDVGTFSCEDGFRKIFNVWDDQQALRDAYPMSEGAYHPPALESCVEENELAENDTMTQGASSLVNMSWDLENVDSFEFQCTSQEGGILVSLSPADLEEMSDRLSFREFIVDNVEVISRYANKVRRLDENESIYIVTGSLKTDSWAIAGYKEQMNSPHDILRLRRANRTASAPTYIWTDRGTADARTGMNKSIPPKGHSKTKNQCLFLRGFKLAVSSRFWARMNLSRPDRDPSSDEPEGPDFNFDFPPNKSDPSGRHQRSRSSGSNQGGQGGSDANNSSPGSVSTCSQDYTPPVQVEVFPSPYTRFQDPYDIINEHLLAENKVDFAITHDSDWMTMMDGSVWKEDKYSALLSKVRASNNASIRNGVAMYDANSARPRGAEQRLFAGVTKHDQGSSHPPASILAEWQNSSAHEVSWTRQSANPAHNEPPPGLWTPPQSRAGIKRDRDHEDSPLDWDTTTLGFGDGASQVLSGPSTPKRAKLALTESPKQRKGREWSTVVAADTQDDITHQWLHTQTKDNDSEFLDLMCPVVTPSGEPFWFSNILDKGDGVSRPETPDLISSSSINPSPESIESIRFSSSPEPASYTVDRKSPPRLTASDLLWEPSPVVDSPWARFG